MDHIKEIMENTNEESEVFSWTKDAIKQGYLINFHRGILKAPKMQYFVLTANGLASFELRPKNDTKPLCFLPYEQLSSIKLDHIELDSCKISCMQLTSKTTPSFTLGFSRKEERDEWMMIMMKAFSETLVDAHILNRTYSTIEENKVSKKHDSATKEKLERKVSNDSYGQTLRRKRRKGDMGSIRRSKSLDTLALHDVTNTVLLPFNNISGLKTPVNPLRAEGENFSFNESRKRKSEPDIHDNSNSVPGAWTSDSKEKLFASPCSFEHRNSLTVHAEKHLKNKVDAEHKSNSFFAKLLSKHPLIFVH